MRKSHFSACVLLALVGMALGAGALHAQDELSPPPLNIILPNYETLPVGQIGGLEGGAYVARVNDATSNWYNPAGLTLAKTSSISSSAGTYQLLSLVPEALPEAGNSVQQVPALVGVVVKKLFGNDQLTAGFALVRTNAWDQETDAQLDQLDRPLPNVLTYSSDSEFWQTDASAAVGWDPEGPWRFGGALATTFTTLRAVEAISNRALSETGTENVFAAGRASGSVTHTRLTAGAQYDASDSWRLGAIIRSPGLRLFRSGNYNLDILVTEGPESTSLVFFDPDITFNYKLPFEAAVGAAWSHDRLEFELDVKFYSGISAYDLFSTQRLATLITDDGQGGPPVVTPVVVQPVVAESQSVVNVAVGGHYAFSTNRVWIVHFGFNTDFTPVGDADRFFTPVDLYGISLGVSGQTTHIIASLGVHYSFGSADNLRLADLLTTNISVDTWGFLYSLAYRF